MKFAEMREQCEAAGYVKRECGVDVCGVNRGRRCCGYSCPSKLYWNGARPQEGYHKRRALERVGLEKAFDAEIGVTDA